MTEKDKRKKDTNSSNKAFNVFWGILAAAGIIIYMVKQGALG